MIVAGLLLLLLLEDEDKDEATLAGGGGGGGGGRFGGGEDPFTRLGVTVTAVAMRTLPPPIDLGGGGKVGGGGKLFLGLGGSEEGGGGKLGDGGKLVTLLFTAAEEGGGGGASPYQASTSVPSLKQAALSSFTFEMETSALASAALNSRTPIGTFDRRA
jgi:hypothetical protein